MYTVLQRCPHDCDAGFAWRRCGYVWRDHDDAMAYAVRGALPAVVRSLTCIANEGLPVEAEPYDLIAGGRRRRLDTDVLSE